MKSIAKIISESLENLSIYFEILFIINGILLLSLYFFSGIYNNGIFNKDFYSKNGIFFFLLGISSSIGAAFFRNVALSYYETITYSIDTSGIIKGNRKCVFFGLVSIILMIFSSILFVAGCFFFEEFIFSPSSLTRNWLILNSNYTFRFIEYS